MDKDYTTNEESSIRIGMVGVGGFGTYRRERLRETGRFNLVAVCDRNTEILQKVADEESAESFSTLEELLKRRPDVEGIVISTSAASHAGLAVLAMEAGRHVFIEKPLCSSVGQARILRAAYRQHPVVAGCGHARMDGDGAYLSVRSLMKDGRLGALAAYEENTSHSGGLELTPGDWREDPENNPGGMLFQCGVHSLHRLIHLFGPIESVQAMMRSDVRPETRTVDAASVLIRHASGVIGTLNAYHVTPYCHVLRIFGTAGMVEVETHDGLGHSRFQQRRRYETEPVIDLPPPFIPPTAKTGNLLAWADAIEGRKPDPDPTLEDGIRAVLPVFAAERAAKESRPVLLRELEDELNRELIH